MNKKQFFPVFIDLSEKHVLVVGAGRIATRRLSTLADFAGKITVVAPDIHPDIIKLAKERNIEILQRTYRTSDLEEADIVIVATTNVPLNVEIAEVCKERGIPVNTSHDKSLCDFYFPGLVKKDNIVIGVTSSGTDHAKARAVTEKLRVFLNEME